MKKNLILEELNRFREIVNYDTKKTNSENVLTISEQEGAIRDIFMADREALGALSKESSLIFKDLRRPILTTTGKELRTIEEVLRALKEGRLSPAESGRFYWSVFKTTENKAIKNITAEYIASVPSTQKAFANKNASEIKDIILNKNKSLNPKDVERIAKKIEEVRNNASELKKGEELKYSDDVKKAEELKYSDDVKKAEELKYSDDVKRSEKLKSHEEALKMTDQEAEELLRQTERTRAETEKVLNRQELEAAETELMRQREELARIKDSKPNVVLHWLKTNRILRWAKKLIFNKWVLLLAGGSLAAYWAWNKWFKDQGISIICEEGEQINLKTGKCEKKEGGGGDTEDSDDDSLSYVGCNDTYFKGCKDTPYGSEIKRLQRCLRIEPTGKFDSETESIVKSEIGKTKLTSSDIDEICGLL